MSDLFHERVPDDYIVAVARVMGAANWHTFQVLTKRAGRLRELLNSKLLFASRFAHVWWGVSVEDKRHGVPRISELRETPASVRFLSIEPLLEDIGEIDLSDIHWVIVGGESGPGARPIEKAWVEKIRKQCRVERVPFFFKQWGGVQKARTGRRLNGRTYDAWPKRVRKPVADKPRRLELVRHLTYDPSSIIPLEQLCGY
jgi:protein gp37